MKWKLQLRPFNCQSIGWKIIEKDSPTITSKRSETMSPNLKRATTGTVQNAFEIDAQILLVKILSILIGWFWTRIRYLKDIAASNAQKFHGGKFLHQTTIPLAYWLILDLGIDQIKNKRNRRAANNAFESYCNPFVVSPWVPTPNPTSWKVSTFAPVGRAIPRQSAYRK